jgi:hypothetical protein
VPALAESLPLNTANPKQDKLNKLTFLGAITIPAGKDKVTGLSGLWVDKNNKDIVTLTDDGRVFQGEMSWAKGNLVGVKFEKPITLKNIDGKKFKRRADTEALARTETGEWLVAFERDHRIWRYSDIEATPINLPLPPVALTLPRNEGLEAVASLPDGGVIALAEVGQAGDEHQGWRLEKGRWQSFIYKGGPSFAPTDMVTISPNSFLVLERRVNLFPPGFQSRLTLWQGGENKELAWLTAPLINENFEGLAITRTEEKLRIYMVSDDNGLAGFQRTILAVFEISLAEVTKH